MVVPSSSLYLPPTPVQIRVITRLAQALKCCEPVEEQIKTRLEARDIIFAFKRELGRRKSK